MFVDHGRSVKELDLGSGCIVNVPVLVVLVIDYRGQLMLSCVVLSAVVYPVLIV